VSDEILRRAHRNFVSGALDPLEYYQLRLRYGLRDPKVTPVVGDIVLVYGETKVFWKRKVTHVDKDGIYWVFTEACDEEYLSYSSCSGSKLPQSLWYSEFCYPLVYGDE
jgi:hypothetical protein